MKRILDIILASVGLVVAAPIMLAIAVLIRIDSPGKVVFSQKRLGKNGNYFFIHKFRKFPDDWGTKGSGVTTQGDVRMTQFGAFLERTKLDELPQLWNILIGEMSFVGPRPESTRYEELFIGEFKKLLDFTPGIFGPNQVAFRNESAMYPADQDPDEYYQKELFPIKAKTDIAYFGNANIFSDIKWMFRSTLGVLVGVVDWHKAKKRYGLIVLVDFLMFQIAWFVAHIIRFEGFNLTESNKEVYLTGFLLIPLIIFPLMLVGGVYRHPFRYFSVKDVTRLVIVTVCSWVLAVFIQYGFFLRNTSIGIVVLSLILFIGLLVLPRLLSREKWIRENPEIDKTRNVLIYGAGKRGSALIKFLEQGFDNIEIIGLIDEDPEVFGRHINGVKVLGSWRDREAIIQRHNVSEIWCSEESLIVTEKDVNTWAIRNQLRYKSICQF